MNEPLKPEDADAIRNMGIPAWAEKQFGPKPDTTIETQMLWAFFDAWEALHAIPNEKANRQKHEAAVDILLEAAHALRTLRAPHRINGINHGT